MSESLARSHRVISAVHHAGSDHPAGVAGGDSPGWNITQDDRAGADNGTFADGHTRADKCARGDPGLLADGDGKRIEREVGTGVVVAGGAEIGVLRDCRVFANSDWGQIVDLDFVADRGVVADLQIRTFLPIFAPNIRSSAMRTGLRARGRNG
jgi:hypothetical protein